MSKKRRSAADLPNDWKELLSLLIAHRVRFVLVGGHAVAIHGRPRYTEDLDVFVEPTVENGRRLREALIEFGLGDATPDAELLATPKKVFMIGRLPLRVDLLTSISGVEFADAWSDRLLVETSAGSVPVLSREHLMTNKRASGRPKDLADIVLLEEAKEAGHRRPKPRKRS